MLWLRVHPECPWLTQQAVWILDNWLRQRDHALEWGSGRSTCWFAARVRQVISVEHDELWYARVKSCFESKQIQNVVYHYAPVLDKRSTRWEEAYFQPALCCPDDSLDFILVDGVLRDVCTSIALAKLRPGGLLCIDDAHRYLRHTKSHSPLATGATGEFKSSVWERVSLTLAEWRSIWTSNGVSDTAFFVKPLRNDCFPTATR